MFETEHIEINPRICGGKPVIKGTRIPISVVLDRVATGESWNEILVDYPELTRDHIRAVVLFAKAALDNAELRETYG